jgi:hypothetical protein
MPMRRAALSALVAISVVAVVAPAQAHRVRVKAPAQYQVSLAQIRYAVPHGARPALRLKLASSAGADYVAAALPRKQPRRAVLALVAIVTHGANPTDPSQIVFSTNPSHRLAAPRMSEASDVLAAAPAAKPSACSLGPIQASGLRLALHSGIAPKGFGARATIAQALAAACGRAVDPAFKAAVAAPTGQPVPTPIPPGKCPPCRPIEPSQPRIVCPLATPPPAICPDAA